MEDNFYTTSTERLFGTPRKQQEKLQQSKNAFERERPLITAVMKHLAEEISIREKVDSITCKDNPEQFMREVEINKQVCNILRRHLSTLESKARMYDKGTLK